jgi:hypothetical protein
VVVAAIPPSWEENENGAVLGEQGWCCFQDKRCSGQHKKSKKQNKK